LLFNSLEFLLFFLPSVWLLFWGFRWLQQTSIAIGSLAITSLIFYAWWNPPYLGLLLISILTNYYLGQRLRDRQNQAWLGLGLGFNLLLLGYFKYTNFFVDSLRDLAWVNWQVAPIILPLGISFFTFQQIGYLVDLARDRHAEHHQKIPNYSWLDYTLFVSFFPQLIAGPIIHHRDILPQFQALEVTPTNRKTFFPEVFKHVAIGLTIFCLGLAKKVLLADEFATIASPLFELADRGELLTIAQAWSAAIFYTLQLYFDFSGYSEMAIGAARLFGITLPINFNSPYQAVSISDFWRRWHITLSNFLRDYLYIPLGGSRSGNVYLNLFLTMLLAGFWHGAGWTFIIWGGLHGIYLVVHRFWQKWQGGRGVQGSDLPISWLSKYLAQGLTFLAVVLGWVLFRSSSLSTAQSVIRSMFFNPDLGTVHGLEIGLAFLGLAIVWGCPNLPSLIANFYPQLQSELSESSGLTAPSSSEQSSLEQFSLERSRQRSSLEKLTNKSWTWQPKPWLGVVFGCLFFLCFKTILSAPDSEFLYFQF